MKAYLRANPASDEMITLVFSQEQAALIEWEGDEEFNWEGRMYDVIQKKTSNGKFSVRCLPDNKESNLLQSFLKATKKSNDTKQQALSKIMATAFLLPQSIIISEKAITIRTGFPEQLFLIEAIALSIQSPPPQLSTC